MRRGQTVAKAGTAAKKTAARKARPAAAQVDSLTLTDVHQVKALADPLRIRILEVLCTAERTTKQVAEQLGEKPTKLYHHVEALEKAGLIRLAHTRQKRGTIEKYYMAVARQFKADSRIFSAADASSGAPEGDALHAMITSVFERTAEEMRSLIAKNSGREGFERQGVFSYLEVRADRKHADALRQRAADIRLDCAHRAVGRVCEIGAPFLSEVRVHWRSEKHRHETHDDGGHRNHHHELDQRIAAVPRFHSGG